jgi:hypothetical protein
MGSSSSFGNLTSCEFDGMLESIQMNATANNISTNTVGTLSCWIRPVLAIPATNDRILHFSDSTSGDYLDFYVATNGKLKIDCRAGGVYQYRWQTNSTSLFGNNAWRHIAIIQDGATGISVYVDGSLRTISLALLPIVDPLAWFNSLTIDTGSIGCAVSGGTPSLFYEGNIDEISIFSTVKAISDLWDGTGKPTDLTGESGLESWFRFDNDTHPIVIDHANVLNPTAVMINMTQANLVLEVP